MEDAVREQAAVLALVKASPGEWYRTADVIAEAGSAVRLLDKDIAGVSSRQRGYAEELVSRVRGSDLTAAHHMIERVTSQGVRLITVLDEDYPQNLRLIYNRPPFLWVRGHLEPRNMRAIAVVGTRQASARGRAAAARLARDLAQAEVTVLSGLARGIDAAAHTAALDAGGRTVAVVGTGITTPPYPPENSRLAERIGEHGAVVSQFWPDAPPRTANFTLRNVVMSGMAAGTVVVEAPATSGAKTQARLALEHGKHLFLLDALLEDQEWARRHAEHPGVTVVHDVADILDMLVTLVEVPRQLSFSL